MLLIKPTPSDNFVRGWVPGLHRGMDWGWQESRVIESTKITAAADGIVIDVYEGSGFNEGWGRRVRIEHAPGIVTTYSHIRPGGILVRVGQRVKAGEQIAWMGSSGASTGTHLHFELYLNDVRVDPQPYFTTHLPGTEPAGGGSIPFPDSPNRSTQEEDMPIIIVQKKGQPDAPKGQMTHNRRMRLITKYENKAYRGAQQQSPDEVVYVDLEPKDFDALLAGRD